MIAPSSPIGQRVPGTKSQRAELEIIPLRPTGHRRFAGAYGHRAVRPGWRQRGRAGLGIAIIRHAAERARHLGRTLLESNAREGSPGSAFARRLGARMTITEVRRVLQVSPSDDGRLATLRDEAEKAASGYSLLSWEGLVPEEHLAAVAAIQASTADMPRPASQGGSCGMPSACGKAGAG